jgi:hypothetical protein
MTDSDSTEPTEGWAAWLDAGRETLQAQLAVGRAGVTLARAVLKGDLDAAGAGRTYTQALQREGDKYWRAAAKLSASYARELAKLSTQTAQDLLNDVRSAPTPAPGATRDFGQPQRGPTRSDAPASSAPAVYLRGPLGGRTTDSFVVTNRNPRPRRIELAPGPVVDGHGQEVPGIALELEPPRVTLAPGQEAVIVVAVDLVRDALVTGGIYHADISVTGGEQATVACTIAVE